MNMVNAQTVYLTPLQYERIRGKVKPMADRSAAIAAEEKQPGTRAVRWDNDAARFLYGVVPAAEIQSLFPRKQKGVEK